MPLRGEGEKERWTGSSLERADRHRELPVLVAEGRGEAWHLQPARARWLRFPLSKPSTRREGPSHKVERQRVKAELREAKMEE